MFRFVLAIAAVVALRLLLLLAAVPPWQNPDEPSHVLGVRILAQRPDLDLSGYYDDLDIEKEILESMRAHRWWQFGGVDPPEGPLEGFGTAHLFTANFGAPPGGKLYYRLLAALLGGLGIDSLTGQLYAMRVFSAVCLVIAVVVGLAATRGAFGPVVALWCGVGVATQPQLAIVGTSASPDALVCLAGACVFAAGVTALSRARPWPWAAGCAAAAALALATRRLGAPLVVVASAVFALLVRRLTWRAGLLLAGTACAMLLLVMTAFPSAREEVARGAAHAGQFLGRLPAIHGPGGLVGFGYGTWRTAWFVPGWLTVSAPSWWYTAVLCVCALAGIGLAWRWPECVRDPLALLCVLAVVVQTAAVYWAYADIGIAQGRYLFPAFFPFFVLQSIGFGAVARGRPAAGAAGLVAVLAALDAYAMAAVVVPAFLT